MFFVLHSFLCAVANTLNSTSPIVVSTISALLNCVNNAPKNPGIEFLVCCVSLCSCSWWSHPCSPGQHRKRAIESAEQPKYRVLARNERANHIIGSRNRVVAAELNQFRPWPIITVSANIQLRVVGCACLLQSKLEYVSHFVCSCFVLCIACECVLCCSVLSNGCVIVLPPETLGDSSSGDVVVTELSPELTHCYVQRQTGGPNNNIISNITNIVIATGGNAQNISNLAHPITFLLPYYPVLNAICGVLNVFAWFVFLC